MKPNNYIRSLFVVILLLISACNNVSSDSSQQASGGPEETYPVYTKLPDMEGTTSRVTETEVIPEIEVETPQLLVIPEPDPKAGIVVGLLFSFTSKESLPNVKVYMADKVPLEPGPGYVISLQANSSPQGETDSVGQILINNIPPGDYVLLMVTPFGSYPLADSETDQIELTVKAGMIYDIGEVYVNWP